MEIKELYIEPTVPPKFDSRLFTYRIKTGSGLRLAIIDDEYLPDAQKLEKAIFPVDDNLEMVLTEENLNDAKTVARITQCYLSLPVEHVGYVNTQSLSATLLLVSQIAEKQDGYSILQTVMNLYDFGTSNIIKLLKSFKFQGDEKRQQYLRNFAQVAQENVDGFKSILRYILRIHKVNVVSKETTTTPLSSIDKNSIVVLKSSDVKSGNHYAELINAFFLSQATPIYLDVGCNYLVSDSFSQGDLDCYVAMAGQDIIRRALAETKSLYSSAYVSPSLLLQYAGMHSEAIPTEESVTTEIRSLGANARTGTYLTWKDNHVMTAKIGAEGIEYQPFAIKHQKFEPNAVKQQPITEAKEEFDNPLAQEFGFTKDADGWL